MRNSPAHNAIPRSSQDLVPGQPVAFFVLIDSPVSRREVPKIAARPCRPGDLLARPLGVAGNTGSGKSCSVARIVQEALRESEGNGNQAKAKFIVLDINGEYAKAFQIEQTAIKELNAVYVNGQRFYLPLRTFNLTEMVAFFEASQASQGPVPERVITEIRENGIDEAPGRALRRIVRLADSCNGYLMYRQVYDTDPATGSQWTLTGVNNGQFGVNCVA
jgi:hypothetical protein